MEKSSSHDSYNFSKFLTWVASGSGVSQNGCFLFKVAKGLRGFFFAVLSYCIIQVLVYGSSIDRTGGRWGQISLLENG